MILVHGETVCFDIPRPAFFVFAGSLVIVLKFAIWKVHPTPFGKVDATQDSFVDVGIEGVVMAAAVVECRDCLSPEVAKRLIV
jgi:hypothetical protein